jgi:hypothetical protein
MPDANGETTFYDVLMTPANTLRDIVLGAQDTIGGIFDDGTDAATEIATGSQNAVVAVFEESGETARTVLNPLGLLGLGAGVSFGGVLAASGLAVGGALVADELLAGGAGRLALVAMVKGRRRR